MKSHQRRLFDWKKRGGNPPEVRVVGFDDGPFNKEKKGDIPVVGAIYRGGAFLDGMVATRIRRDGHNATDKLIAVLRESRYFPQLHYIMLDGIAFGGFNVVDINRLNEQTGLSVLVVIRKRPNLKAIKKALMNLPRWEKRWRLIEQAGETEEISGLHVQRAGPSIEETEILLELTCVHSKLPEPIRAAHIIAGAWVTGQGGKRP